MALRPHTPDIACPPTLILWDRKTSSALLALPDGNRQLYPPGAV